jgi:hypothetical protein
MSIKLSETPQEHYTKLFENLLQFRGVEGSKKILVDDESLKAAFPWCLSKEGHEFWETIDDSGNSITTTTTTANELDELVKEAESRGFKIGVWTKFGKIGSGIDHELCDDGSFYYRNIKVRTKKGKWCKPGVMPKQGGFYDRPNIIPKKPLTKSQEDVDNEDEVMSAIHATLKRMFETMHR